MTATVDIFVQKMRDQVGDIGDCKSLRQMFSPDVCTNSAAPAKLTCSAVSIKLLST